MGKYGSRHRKNRDAYLGQDNVRCWLCGEVVVCVGNGVCVLCRMRVIIR